MSEQADTRGRLPCWVEQRVGYGGQVFLHGVVLGFTRGEWPVQAFAADADGGCSMGARWAAGKDGRVLVGPVMIPDDVPVRTATRVPERFDLLPTPAADSPAVRAEAGEEEGGE